MTDVTTAALVLVLKLCDVGLVTLDACEDGSPAPTYEVRMVVAHPGVRNAVEITKDGISVFTLGMDGRTKAVRGFRIDPLAVQFWKVFAEKYPSVCIEELAK